MEDYHISEENTYMGLPLDEYGNPVYTSDWLKSNTRIGGGLLLFLIFLGLGVCYVVYNINDTLTAAGNGDFFSIWYMVYHVIVSIYSIYIIYAFRERKANAVFYAKSAVIIGLVSNIFLFIVLRRVNITDASLMGSTVGCIVWLLVLYLSNNIKEVIPPSYRAISTTDIVIVSTYAFITIFPVFLLLLGAFMMPSV